MMSVSPQAVSRELGHLFDGGSLTGLNDRELIDRYRNGENAAAEAAFELLVARHGPMVQRVCRNALARPEDVDDAFQATFLILAKQAGSIRKLESLASWLYGVASRVAARARVDFARRRRAERHILQIASETQDRDEPAAELERTLFGPIVQQEVSRLPDKYRTVVLLCYWEGLTQEQAAHQLGCPLGTVRSRAARARELLERRLTRRGLNPSLLLGTATKGQTIQPLAPVSTILARTSTQSALHVLAGQSAAEGVSAAAVALARKTLRSMALIKIRNLLVVAVVSGLFIAGTQLLAQQDPKPKPVVEPRPAEPRAEKPESPTVPRSQLAHVIEPPDLLLVEVLEALPGRPVSGERLVRPDGTISLGFYGDVEVAGLTLPEAKEKIVERMRKFLNDDVLGLVQINAETGEPQKGPDGKPVTIHPRNTDRVFVDITAYNSKHYFVYGWVNCATPARLPITGGDTVLDALSFVNGLRADADSNRIYLLRSFPRGSAVRKLPVNFEEITTGTDMSTNYQLLPGDRLVIPRAVTTEAPVKESRSSGRLNAPDNGLGNMYFERGRQYFEEAGDIPVANGRDRSERSSPDLDRRLRAIEEKLDSLLNTPKAKMRKGESPVPSPF